MGNPGNQKSECGHRLQFSSSVLAAWQTNVHPPTALRKTSPVPREMTPMAAPWPPACLRVASALSPRNQSRWPPPLPGGCPSTNCAEEDISCPEGNDPNGCPMVTCMPKGSICPMKPAARGECPPMNCAEEDISCPEGDDPNGCPMATCMPKGSICPEPQKPVTVAPLLPGGCPSTNCAEEDIS